MKQPLYLLAIVLNLNTAHAATATNPSDCEAWKNKASLYMNWRQQATPLVEAVKETTGNRSRGLLLRAYQVPIQQGFKAQYTAIESFSDTLFQECQTQSINP